MGHSLFKRDGNDLRMDMKISLKEAILGFEKTIRHLDGRNVQISSDYNVQNGE
jgi:DnaJ-class molecular chaperone